MAHSRDWEQLRELLCRDSVRFGDFLLASGQHSDVYVDAKLTTCRAEAMPLVGRVFLDKLEERGWFPDAVGGLTMGADPVAMSIARESVTRNLAINCFVVRKEPKKHGMKKYLEGLQATDGIDVVVIDDVCTTGGSTATAIERAREAGLHVLGALCLVDREMGAKERLEETLHCPFDRIFTLEELTHAGCESVAPFAASRTGT